MIVPVAWGATSIDALIKTGPGILHSVVLTAGSDAATVILYDNTAASGTVLVTVKVATGETVQVIMNRPITTGIYADVTGTTPLCYVGYV